jgi:hypothetical protein
MSQDKVHIMVDIETLDTENTAVILSIGACGIQPNNLHRIFYEELNPETQENRTVSLSTQQWWKDQASKGISMPSGKTHIKDALNRFAGWIEKCEGTPIIWCKGTDFDVKILTDAFKQYTIPVPWKYNDVRDARTLLKLHPQITYPTNPVPHHALQDALYQARYLTTIFAYNDRLHWE